MAMLSCWTWCGLVLRALLACLAHLTRLSRLSLGSRRSLHWRCLLPGATQTQRFLDTYLGPKALTRWRQDLADNSLRISEDAMSFQSEMEDLIKGLEKTH